MLIGRAYSGREKIVIIAKNFRNAIHVAGVIKTSFWSNTEEIFIIESVAAKDFRFREMPSLGLPEVEKDRFIDNCATYFLGDPNKLLNAKEGEGEEAAEEVPKEEEEGEEGE